MGWCAAQWKMLLFFAKTIVKESCKFELARRRRRRRRFWLSGDFLVRYFRDAFKLHWVCCLSWNLVLACIVHPCYPCI